VQQKWFSTHQGLASAVATQLRHASGTLHAPGVLQELPSLLHAARMLPTRRSRRDAAGVTPVKMQPGLSLLTFTSLGHAPDRALSQCRTVLKHARKGLLDPERRVTNGLIAVNAALFAAQVVSKGAVTQWGVKVLCICVTSPHCTCTRIPAAWLRCLRMLFSLLPVLAFIETVTILLCLQYAPAIAAGQWWRLISCNFLHSTWWHLGMNMLAVSNLGAACERDCGPKRMMAVYSTACLMCGVASYLFTPGSSLGASGKVEYPLNRGKLKLMLTSISLG